MATLVCVNSHWMFGCLDVLRLLLVSGYFGGFIRFRPQEFQQRMFRPECFSTKDISAYEPFGPKDVSAPGHFGTWMFRPQGRFGTRTLRPKDVSVPGHFDPQTYRPLDISAPGHFGPQTFSPPKLFDHRLFWSIRNFVHASVWVSI